ncbi:hypothetical protein M231_00854 [Tremella mesenterica]|uniref:Uncharacterized protein n=1 Tax=Tremella mesenterica TaxID=5217 RepID=A0A4Q1BUT4_TREME|nr:hypothetical protein M231_00854 [Tremella mesenterica]
MSESPSRPRDTDIERTPSEDARTLVSVSDRFFPANVHGYPPSGPYEPLATTVMVPERPFVQSTTYIVDWTVNLLGAASKTFIALCILVRSKLVLYCAEGSDLANMTARQPVVACCPFMLDAWSASVWPEGTHLFNLTDWPIGVDWGGSKAEGSSPSQEHESAKRGILLVFPHSIQSKDHPALSTWMNHGSEITILNELFTREETVAGDDSSTNEEEAGGEAGHPTINNILSSSSTVPTDQSLIQLLICSEDHGED